MTHPEPRSRSRPFHRAPSAPTLTTCVHADYLCACCVLRTARYVCVPRSCVGTGRPAPTPAQRVGSDRRVVHHRKGHLLGSGSGLDELHRILLPVSPGPAAQVEGASSTAHSANKSFPPRKNCGVYHVHARFIPR